MKNLLIVFLACTSLLALGQKKRIQQIEKESKAIELKMVDWRRQIHANPELSNREFETAMMVAEHLKTLGIEVQENVAHTGVVGILKGGKPGPVIGLRADMDALPVTERNDLPFRSKNTATYNGVESGVMHACGHDTHVAILMAAAEVLSKMKKDLRGTVKFIFQPAEEGAPPGEEGGAKLMIKEGVLKNPDVDAVFGLHINAATPVHHVGYKSGGLMAAADRFVIKVNGVQSHGSRPWGGVDPIYISSQIIDGLQGIISRSTELTKEAAVITVGVIRAGNRNNIIPETAEMIGTIRTLDPDMQDKLHAEMQRVVENTAKAHGGTATLEIFRYAPVTYNDPQLTIKSAEVLQRVLGSENVHTINAVTGAEDFAFYAKEVPSFFFFLGGLPSDHKEGDFVPAHHTPDFYIDDSGMISGLKALLNLTIDFLDNQ